MANNNDDQLVRLCLEGNQEAWKTLISTYRSLVIRTILRFYFNPPLEDVEDLAQYIFLDLLQKSLKRFNPSISGLSTYIVTIAKNKTQSFLRSKDFQRRKASISIDNPIFEEIERTISPVPPHEPSEPSPLELALDKLNSNEKRLFQLYHLDKKTMQKISQIEGYSISKVSRTLKKIQKKLQKLAKNNY